MAAKALELWRPQREVCLAKALDCLNEIVHANWHTNFGSKEFARPSRTSRRMLAMGRKRKSAVHEGGVMGTVAYRAIGSEYLPTVLVVANIPNG
jgi:hypothetical protein